ncbi:hypothetical protein LXA43DRAFT_191053 [Ganoderma leucocontextum]|nr:hypothetical protein LXA43DRAFT_191053 [Ganoderma leucocontextum]
MAADLRRRLINPFGDQFPDDNSTKEIVLQADGLVRRAPGQDRRVLLCWTNGVAESAKYYTQVIHLTGGPGSYAFYTPQVKMQSQESLPQVTVYSLGHYTRVQRDQIILLAKAIRFDRHSRVDGCRVWTRDLLDAMVNVDMLQRTTFDMLVAEIPLPARLPELPTTV